MRKTIFLILIAWMFSSCQQSSARKLAFVSDRVGNYEIYVIRSDGSSPINVSNNPGNDSKPTWSPNGNLLAFQSTAFGIRVFDTTSEAFIFSSNDPSDEVFSWSPDSSRIAFHSLRNRDNRWEIFTIGINDYFEPRQLTKDSMRDNACAAWSPDGQLIGFTSGDASSVALSVGDLFVMRPDGSDVRWLAESDDKNWIECPYFSWSPDSNWIALYDLHGLVIVDIATGTTAYPVEADLCISEAPSWSPNGKFIAFTSNFCTRQSKEDEIFVLDIDLLEILQLTDNTSSDYYPVWSPDGKQIAFVSTRDGNREIYLMQANGSEQVNLTNNPANDFSPSWQP
jgi:Tol biopolymer transport system component